MQAYKNNEEDLNVRVVKLESSMDNIKYMLDRIDKRFDSMERSFNESILRVEKTTNDSILRLEKTMNDRFDNVDKIFQSIDKKFDNVDKRFDVVDKKFERIETKMESIDSRLDAWTKWIVGIGVTSLIAVFGAIINIALKLNS